MNKEQLVKSLALEAKIDKSQAEKVIDAFIITVRDQLARNETINISGLGIFYLSKRQSYEGKNPRTGEKMTMPAVSIPYFRPSRVFVESIK